MAVQTVQSIMRNITASCSFILTIASLLSPNMIDAKDATIDQLQSEIVILSAQAQEVREKVEELKRLEQGSPANRRSDGSTRSGTCTRRQAGSEHIVLCG